jgi:hypothetical protein
LTGRTSLVAVSADGPEGTDWMNVAFTISGLDACPSDAATIPLSPVAQGNFVVR